MRRIFKKDGRSLIVAMDHAKHSGVLPGLENPGRVMQQIVQGGADGIMTTYGVLKNYSDVIAGNLATILRLDDFGTTKYGIGLDQIKAYNLHHKVQDAVRLGADGVIVTALLGLPSEGLSLKNLGLTAGQCEEWGMPFAAELIVGGFEPSEKFKNLYDVGFVADSARIGAEYGADIIKTNYTGTVDGFKRVIENCPVPVLIAGGPKVGEEIGLLRTVEGMVEAGGSGVFFGRNIWQYKNPLAMTRAISRIIHDGATAEEAVKELK
jgi:DhnA family fructose-bisphosphate aldolase class Ia